MLGCINLDSRRRVFHCSDAHIGSSPDVAAHVPRKGFRSAMESEALMKQREMRRHQQLGVIQTDVPASKKRQPFQTFPQCVSRCPPLPDLDSAPARVIKFIEEAMREIFPPLPERTYTHLTVIGPEQTDTGVVDTRDLRVKCVWEPYAGDVFTDIADAVPDVVDRPQPVSPFKERTDIGDLFAPPTLSKLLHHLSRGPFSKTPMFNPHVNARDLPLLPRDRAMLVSESSRRAAGSCPPDISTLISRKKIATTSSTVHQGTVLNRKAMKLRHAPDDNEASSGLFSSFLVEQLHAEVKQEQQHAQQLGRSGRSSQLNQPQRQTFGNYLTA